MERLVKCDCGCGKEVTIEQNKIQKETGWVHTTNTPREIPIKTIYLNGASIEVYEHSLIFNDDEREEIIGELEWKDIYRLAEEELL